MISLTVEEEDYLRKQERHSPPTLVTQTEIMDFLVSVTQEAHNLQRNHSHGSTLSFSNDETGSDDYYFTLTGLKRDQFHTLLKETKLQSSKRFDKRTSLALYLVRIRTGLPLHTLSVLFGCKSRREVSQRLCRTRKQLFKCQIMQKYFGFSQMTRLEMIQSHTTEFAKQFFGLDAQGQVTKPVVIVDGNVK